jgi:PAS domain S-box-containing protein
VEQLKGHGAKMSGKDGGARDPWLQATTGLLLPPVLALVLFAVAVATVIVPATERALMERKRETLRAIVGAATSLLGRHVEEAARHGVPPDDAQRTAIEDLRGLRYGDAAKDYLWIMDRDLRMVLHPYRSDLEGQSLADFRDPAGKPVFVESLAIVDASGEGYVEYLWQWQDDPARIEPKLSFIREFKPWGWIVGTGLYLDDVRASMRQVTRRLYGAAGLAGAGMLLLLAVGMRQGWVAERRRRAAERDLAESRERYRVLAHASADMAILFHGGRVAGANRTACERLGVSEHDLLGRPVEQLLHAERDAELIAAVRTAAAATERETLLAGRSQAVPAMLSCSLVHLGEETAVLLAGRDLRPAAEEPAEADAAGLGRLRFALDRALTILRASPLARRLLNERGFPEQLDESEMALLRHELETQPAVAGMLLRTRQNRALRLWAARLAGPAEPAAFDATLADATDEMHRRELRTGASGPGLEPDGDLGRAWLRAVDWAETAARSGQYPELVTGPLGHFLDRLVRRACSLTIGEIGNPPAPAVVLAVGSIGRGEPTLNPDQDTAMILTDGVDYGDWPARFGEALTARLEAAGLPACRAGHTAAQTEWRLTLAGWRDRFGDWIRNAEPKALMQVNIFFDFRALWGEVDPAEELRRHIFARVGERPVFLRHLAADTMEFRAPLDALGRIRADHSGEDHLDVKGAMLHVVNFARIYSLRHGIRETGTVARLTALGQGNHLPADTVQETLHAWRHLSEVRLRLQVDRLDRGLVPDNRVVLPSLSAWDRAVLKLALAQIGHLQQRLASEILHAV